MWVGAGRLQACSSLGPNALSQGRPAYNEAIAATNAESKQYFLLFQTLLSVQLSGDEAASRGPVLTVPVN